jgi:hypothetical protein
VEGPGATVDRRAARALILPLALAQFIASYAATNMNVAISAIATDLDTTVAGVQTAITLFTLTMAAVGLFFVVLGLLQARTYGFLISRTDFKIGNTVLIPKGSISPVWVFVAIGALFLLWFFLHVHSREKRGRDVLLPLRMFRNKVAILIPRQSTEAAQQTDPSTAAAR